jgi:fibronectin type 3 domain-containing protein
MAPEFRVFRKLQGAPEQALIGTSTNPSYLDGTIEYGKTYSYYVQSVRKTGDTFAESEISGINAFTPKDKFPPAVPMGLLSVPGTQSIELVWQPNGEKDFASYRIYRDGQRIAADVTAPAFSDRNVKQGVKYNYQISAVDTAGNESAKSAAVESALP